MLEHVQVEVRPRTAWEAVDLGLRLTRVHARAAYGAYLALALPAAALLFLAFHEHPWAAALVLWWLKPLFDRAVLHVLAQATFGTVPTVLQTLRALPSAAGPGLVGSLTWRRLTPVRSFLLPVFQLERLRGGTYRRRRAVLLARTSGPAQGVTLVMSSFEIVVALGLLALALFFTPEGTGTELWRGILGGGTPGPVALWLGALLPVAASCLLEPLYVGAGFALYLNRRVLLEGWDLELAFRRLARRLAARAGAALLLLAFALPALRAQEAGVQGGAILEVQAAPEVPARLDPAVDATAARAQVQSVYRAPELQTTRKVTRWQRKGEQEQRRPSARRLPEWLLALLRPLAFLLKVLVIAAAAAGLIWLFWRYRETVGLGGRGEDYRPPEVLFGLDLRPESLPDDIPGTAWALWQRGEVRAALALLYRGALAALVRTGDLELPQGATEGDCLKAARPRLGTEAARYFGALTEAWILAAYGARRPPDELGRDLCRNFAAHFGSRP